MKYLLLLALLTVFACKTPAPESTEKSNIETSETEITYTTLIGIEGMTCTGCESTIEAALKNLDGIQAADASHESATAKIAVKNWEIDTVLIKNTLSEAGYTFVSIENIE